MEPLFAWHTPRPIDDLAVKAVAAAPFGPPRRYHTRRTALAHVSPRCGLLAGVARRTERGTCRCHLPRLALATRPTWRPAGAVGASRAHCASAPARVRLEAGKAGLAGCRAARGHLVTGAGHAVVRPLPRRRSGVAEQTSVAVQGRTEPRPAQLALRRADQRIGPVAAGHTAGIPRSRPRAGGTGHAAVASVGWDLSIGTLRAALAATRHLIGRARLAADAVRLRGGRADHTAAGVVGDVPLREVAGLREGCEGAQWAMLQKWG